MATVVGYKDGVAPAGAAGSPYAGIGNPPPGAQVAADVTEFLGTEPNPTRHLVKQFAAFEVDYTDIAAVATKYLGPVFKAGSFVTRAFYKVTDTFTSATDAATIGIGFNTDDAAGLVAATAISAGGNIWDAGNHECIETGTAANFGEVLTADRQIEFLRGGAEVLTAGHLVLYVEWVESV